MIKKITLFGIRLQSRRQRRLIVVGYYLLVSTYPLIALIRGYRVVSGQGNLIYPTFFLAGLLGGIRTGGPVKPYEGPDVGAYPDGMITLHLNGRGLPVGPISLDERETAQRDHAHYRAYATLRWVIAAAAILYWLPFDSTPVWLQHWTPMLLWTLLMFTLSLPQAIILWTEPDPIAETDLALVASNHAS